MRLLIAMGLGLMLATPAFAADEAKKPEDLVKDVIKVMKEITTILESVKDEDTGKAAVPKLEKAAAKMKKLGEVLKANKPSKDEEAELKKKYEKEIMGAIQKMIAASIQAGTNAPNQAKAIGAALQKAR